MIWMTSAIAMLLVGLGAYLVGSAMQQRRAESLMGHARRSYERTTQQLKIQEKDLTGKISSLEEELAKLKQEHRDLLARMDEEKETAKLLLRDCEELNKKLKGAVLQKETEIQNLRREIDDLNTTIMELSEGEKDKPEGDHNVDEYMESMDAMIGALQEEIDSLHTELRESEELVAKLRDRLVELGEDPDSL